MIDQFFVNTVFCSETGDLTISSENHLRIIEDLNFNDNPNVTFRKGLAKIITLEYLYKYPAYKFPFLNSYVNHTQSDPIADKHLELLLAHPELFSDCHRYETDEPLSEAVKRYVDKLIARVERYGYNPTDETKQVAYKWFNDQQQLLDDLVTGRGLKPEKYLNFLWIAIDNVLKDGKKLQTFQTNQVSVTIDCCIYNNYIDSVDSVELT